MWKVDLLREQVLAGSWSIEGKEEAAVLGGGSA